MRLYLVIRIAKNLADSCVREFNVWADADKCLTDMMERDKYWMDHECYARRRNNSYRIADSAGRYAKARIVRLR